MTTFELIAFIANISLALSFLVAVVFGIFQVRTAAHDRRERLTLEALRNFQSREFAELTLFISGYNMPSTAKEFDARPMEDRVRFFQFAQEMESLGLLVAERHINIDLVDKTLGSLVSTAWEKYKTPIVDMRVKRTDPFLAEYFQWLAELIDERMRTSPRKPFHETPGYK